VPGQAKVGAARTADGRVIAGRTYLFDTLVGWAREELEHGAYSERLEPQAVVDYCVQWLEGGGNFVTLAAKFPHEPAVSYDMLQRFLVALAKKHPDLDVAGRFREARRAGSHALIDEAQWVVDNAMLAQEALKKAEMQSKLLQWRAGRYNREDYGQVAQQSQVNVNVSLGSAHLDALRARAYVPPAVTPTAALGTAAAEQADYTVEP